MKGYYNGYSFVVIKDGKKYEFVNEEEAKEYFNEEIETDEEEDVEDGEN